MPEHVRKLTNSVVPRTANSNNAKASVLCDFRIDCFGCPNVLRAGTHGVHADQAIGN
jgi:hypothetical protein